MEKGKCQIVQSGKAQKVNLWHIIMCILSRCPRDDVLELWSSN